MLFFVQPVGMSAIVSVWMKLPATDAPPCATRSRSQKPGGGEFQALNVRMDTSRRIADGYTARRRLPPAAVTVVSLSIRSIVAALTVRTLARSAGSSCSRPCRSSAGSNDDGITTFRRLPQRRSEASYNAASASATTVS